jgi:hypothetical protein
MCALPQARKSWTDGGRISRPRGFPVEADFRWPNEARSIYVRDPAGNSVEFAEPRLWDYPD